VKQPLSRLANLQDKTRGAFKVWCKAFRWGTTSIWSNIRADSFAREKASISEELAGIFERLGLSAQRWQHGMEKLRGDRLVGRFFAASRAKLREIADRIGVRHLVNLTGCPIR
jgi:hypothetical protein